MSNHSFPSAALAELIEVIGEDSVYRLCAHYGGTDLYIPTLRRLEQPLRDRRICRAAAEGASMRQLCVRFALSERQIRRILARGPAVSKPGPRA